MYIEPTIHIHSTFAEAKNFSNTYGPYYSLSEQAPIRIHDIVRGGRNLIVGEPGVGKTLLLSKLEELLKSDGVPTRLVPLRNQNSLTVIDQCVRGSVSSRFALLLDGLDEVQGSVIPSILERIDEVSKTKPNIGLYVSSRSVFADRHSESFATFRVVTISPFAQEQVRRYLISAGHSDAEVDSFLRRVMSSGHNTLVLQIPRYLFLLSEFLTRMQIDSVKSVSRSEIFEYFIYQKLNLEDERLNTNNREITKRLLEKLALTMEIYQANVISKDELITFLDELQSDLKLAALTQFDLQMFFDKSLLKDNIEAIEFDNTEFQEYLAAKEMTRFPDPRLAAFSFAAEPNISEIHPTWFNTLTFLVDMHPDLLEQLIEFSGIRGDRIIDEGFINFLTRLDPSRMKNAPKRTLFRDLVAYYKRGLQWVPVSIASLLASIFEPSQENVLKDQIADSESEVDHRRYIPLANVAMIVGQVLASGAALDRPYWRNELLRFAADQNENGVLQRNALLALEKLKDPTVIAELPSSLIRADELIVKAFLTLCTEVAPDDPISIQYFIEATCQNEIHARYGFYALKGRDALKIFLKALNSDVALRRQFLEKSSIFKEQDRVIAEHIEAVCDDELIELCKQVVVHSFHFDFAHDAERSAFIIGIGELLKRKIPDFFPTIIREIERSGIPSGFFFTRGLFAALVELENVHNFVSAMIEVDQQPAAFGVLHTVKLSGKRDAEKIFEAGRTVLPDQYEAWEEHRTRADAEKDSHRDRIRAEFQQYLEPEPGKFSPAVFGFYMDHAKELKPLISSDERKRLAELITGSVFNNIDPAKYELTATGTQAGSLTSYTVSQHITVFGDALRVAANLGVDVGAFRQRVVNYIPFAYSDHLDAIFKLIPALTSEDMKPVMEIYNQHKSDLWRHMPSNLVDPVERYRIVEALPILKAFVKESTLPSFIRRRAIVVADSFDANKGFLQDVAAAYATSSDPNARSVAEVAFDLLITGHSDPNAIRGRIRAIIERAAPFTPPAGGHFVNALESEVIVERSFAAPLMKLRTRGFEEDYLQLLDSTALLWGKGKSFYAYAKYQWDIVFAYFDNLKEYGSYEPLQVLERKLNTMRDKHGSNWLLARVAQLRRSYLTYLGKPQNIAESVRKYNHARHHDNKKIVNSEDLHYHLKDVIETELARWIQAEGAYDLLLTGKVYRGKIQQYEKLVQKTLKSQLENILLRRGFGVEVVREPQLLDEKRIDLLVRYGFAGPVIIEVKLSSNTDMKMRQPERSASFISMKRYMEGYGASHGIFLIIDNAGSKSLEKVQEAFAQIPNVWVKVFDYRKDIPVKLKTRKSAIKRR
jgi:hypothetical protein